MLGHHQWTCIALCPLIFRQRDHVSLLATFVAGYTSFRLFYSLFRDRIINLDLISSSSPLRPSNSHFLLCLLSLSLPERFFWLLTRARESFCPPWFPGINPSIFCDQRGRKHWRDIEESEQSRDIDVIAWSLPPKVTLWPENPLKKKEAAKKTTTNHFCSLIWSALDQPEETKCRTIFLIPRVYLAYCT